MTSRIYAYLRVSKDDLNTDNQALAITNAGYDIPESRIVTDIISGGTLAMTRPGFSNLFTNKLESGDTLVVAKVDRLGRDNIDVQQTINTLLDKGIKVICLDLPEQDLTKPSAKAMLQMIAVFAEFERSRIRERTLDGLARAKAEGKDLGRPKFTGADEVQRLKAQGHSQSEVATQMGISLSTVKRNWNTN